MSQLIFQEDITIFENNNFLASQHRSLAAFPGSARQRCFLGMCAVSSPGLLRLPDTKRSSSPRFLLCAPFESAQSSDRVADSRSHDLIYFGFNEILIIIGFMKFSGLAVTLICITTALPYQHAPFTIFCTSAPYYPYLHAYYSCVQLDSSAPLAFPFGIVHSCTVHRIQRVSRIRRSLPFALLPFSLSLWLAYAAITQATAVSR